MKIVAVETYPVRVPLKPERHMITALGEHTVSEYLLVRVLTDSGIEGAGEATVSPLWSGETVWGAQALIDRLFAPALLGMEPGDVGAVARRLDRIATHNWFAKSAIEMACWDIRGKAAGKPVYELLGGAVRPLTIRSRFSMGAYGPERAAPASWWRLGSRHSRSRSAPIRRATSSGCGRCARRRGPAPIW